MIRHRPRTRTGRQVCYLPPNILVGSQIGRGDNPSPFFCGALGFAHPLIEGVDFTDLPRQNIEWWADAGEPHVVTRSRRSPWKFQAFRSDLDVPMSWEILPWSAEVWSCWEAFSRSVA